MPPAQNDIIRVVAKLSLSGGDIQNVFHCKLNTVLPATTDADLLADIAGVLDDAYDDIKTEQPQFLDYDTISIYNLTQDAFVGETPWPVLTTGTGTGVMPPQTAGLVLFPTDILRSQGRKFLPPETDVGLEADGTITTTRLTKHALWAAAFIGDVVTTNLTVRFGNYNTPLARFAQWTSAIAKDFFATQRRRYASFGS